MDNALLNFNPCIKLCFSAYMSKFEKTSAQMMKRYGDNGHSCLNHLCGQIKYFAKSLIKIEKLVVEIQLIIRFIQFEEKPSWCIAFFKNFHSILSQALPMSNLSATSLFLFSLFCLILLRHSCPIITLSVISLFEIKAL